MALTDIDGARLDDSALYAGKNLIINGAMQVAQRGTSSTSTGYLVDRFEIGFGQGAVTTSQESLSSGDPYNEGFRKFLRLTNSTSSTAANSYREITQKIEAQNLAKSGWNYASSSSYITISFWVRASVAQTYYLKLKTNDGTAQAYASAVSLSADTWTKITKTIPGNSNITINNDNGNGFNVALVPFYGTDFTDSSFTTDTWAAYGSNQLPDMTNTWAGTTNATFDITGVQLEVGASASAFEHRSYGDDLQRCQRYYQRLQSTLGDTIVYVGYNAGTTSSRGTVYLPVSMRTSPTAVETTGTASDYNIRSGGSTTTCNSVPSFEHATTQSIGLQFNVSGGLTTDAVSMCRFVNTDGFLAWGAEL
jgi:hypothetical protein